MATLDLTGVIVSCRSCNRQNRLAYAQLSQTHRCAQCKAELSPPDTPVAVPSPQAFDALVRSGTVPVLVDFWAPWCAPCRAVAPEFEKVARARAGRLIVAKINTDELPELGDRFSIRSIPTLAVFAGGREVARTSGSRPAAAIEAFVDDALVTA